MLAVGDRLQHQLAGERVATNQLNHNVDGGVTHHFVGITAHRDGITHQGARLGHIANCHAGDLDPAPGTSGDFFGVAFEHLPCTTAHHTQAQQANFD